MCRPLEGKNRKVAQAIAAPIAENGTKRQSLKLKYLIAIKISFF